MRLLFALLAFVAGHALAAEADVPDQAAVISYLNELRSFSAHFEQQRLDEHGELLESASGECRIARPGRFRWHYAEPYPQLIVSNGERLWIYDEDLEQVTVSALETSLDSPAALLASDADIGRHYELTALDSDAEGNRWWRFRPTTTDTEQYVELGFRDGEVSAMRLFDQLGQVTRLRFQRTERDIAIDPAQFEFTAPAGVDVVQGGLP